MEEIKERLAGEFFITSPLHILQYIPSHCASSQVRQGDQGDPDQGGDERQI